MLSIHIRVVCTALLLWDSALSREDQFSTGLDAALGSLGKCLPLLNGMRSWRDWPQLKPTLAPPANDLFRSNLFYIMQPALQELAGHTHRRSHVCVFVLAPSVRKRGPPSPQLVKQYAAAEMVDCSKWINSVKKEKWVSGANTLKSIDPGYLSW